MSAPELERDCLGKSVRVQGGDSGGVSVAPKFFGKGLQSGFLKHPRL